MKKFVLLIATAFFLLSDADAFDVSLLANNKEAISRHLSRQSIFAVSDWVARHRLGNELKMKSVLSLKDTFNEMEKIDTTCEIGLVRQLQNDAKKYGVIDGTDEFLTYIAYLRNEDLIDDILYKLLEDSAYVDIEMQETVNRNPPPRPWNLNTRQNAGMDLKKFFEPIQKWPDDVKRCSIDTLFNMVKDLKWKNSKDLDGQLLKLNYLGYSDGYINLETFNKLETLRKRDVMDWPIYFKRYADVINNAKDKLTKSPDVKSTNDFSSEYVSRKDKITKRGHLYRTYNSTQIIMLAQIIEKAAKRMDAKEAYLRWQYTEDPDGEHEIYVLSPMEQYRVAIRMLRKDMAEVMRSQAFQNTGLQYEDLISAAYETGFIKSEELDHVLKFEDLWNPKTPKWKKYANFAFSLAGTASFYLPPPWNIIGAIGLVLTQSKLVNGDQQPDPDDNWNVII
ncbi:MAG: hypothetical protein ACLGHN_03455 [Bacteriovoracia bacterium]